MAQPTDMHAFLFCVPSDSKRIQSQSALQGRAGSLRGKGRRLLGAHVFVVARQHRRRRGTSVPLCRLGCWTAQAAYKTLQPACRLHGSAPTSAVGCSQPRPVLLLFGAGFAQGVNLPDPVLRCDVRLAMRLVFSTVPLALPSLVFRAHCKSKRSLSVDCG